MTWFFGIAIILYTFTSAWARTDILGFPLFLPILASGIIAVVITYIRLSKQANTRFSRILVPLVIILLFIWIRCLMDNTDESISKASFITVTGIVMYVIGRTYGIRVFWPLAIVAVLQSVSVVIIALFFSDWNSGMDIRNGGFIDRDNYALGQAVIVIGLVSGIYLIKSVIWKAVFVSVCTLGLLFTGSPEAFVFLIIIGLYTIYKGDITKPLRNGLVIVVVLFAVWVLSGPGLKQYDRLGEVTTFVSSGDIVESESWDDDVKEDKYSWGDGRLPVYKQSVNEASMFGHGYAIYNAQDYHKKVHNVPLVIVDQIGLIPALAWLGVTLYCLVRSKHKYLWIGIIVLGLFNHTTWTVFAPYWWLAVGLMAYEGRDYVLRTDKETI